MPGVTLPHLTHFLLRSSCQPLITHIWDWLVGTQAGGEWPRGGCLSLIRQVGVWNLQGEAEEAVLFLAGVAPPPSPNQLLFPSSFPILLCPHSIVPSLPIAARSLFPQQLPSPHPQFPVPTHQPACQQESPVDRLVDDSGPSWRMDGNREPLFPETWENKRGLGVGWWIGGELREDFGNPDRGILCFPQQP